MEINPGFEVRQVCPDARQRDMRYRRYRMKWDSYPKYDITDWVPIHLDLEVTARCQLKCPGCPSVKLDFSKGDMDEVMAYKALKEFGEFGGCSVKFNWRGEPTIYKKLPGLVKLAKQYDLIDIMMNTNGVSLTPKLSKDLVEAGMNNIAVSIDSIDKDRYEILRPGAKLDKVLLNLRALLREVEKNDEVYVRVQRIDYPDEPMKFHDFVKYFADNFPRVNAVAENHYKVKEIEGDSNRPSSPCCQLWQRLVMTYDGWVGPCCEFNRFGEHRFGRFPDRSLFDIWRSIELDGLRRYHRQGRQNEIDACHKCTVTKPMVRH